jgi:hypothetical protein
MQALVSRRAPASGSALNHAKQMQARNLIIQSQKTQPWLDLIRRASSRRAVLRQCPTLALVG